MKLVAVDWSAYKGYGASFLLGVSIVILFEIVHCLCVNK